MEMGKGILESILEDCREKGVTIDEWLRIALSAMKSIPAFSKENGETLEQKVTKIMRELGVPANLTGYEYIRFAVLYSLENEGSTVLMTKVLYPEIAKKFQSTPTKVERSIRHAIEISFSRANNNLLEEIFGYATNSQKGRATNSEFIAEIVDYIKVNWL